MFKDWIYAVRTCNVEDPARVDPVGKWLLISRSCVFSMTLISGLIGGLLALAAGHFRPGLFVLVLVGLVLAHASNNMVNDLFDVLGGVDTEDYPRANYAPHPILDNMVTKRSLVIAIMVCNLVCLAIAVYLTAVAGWPVLAFAVAGLLTSVFYVAPPLKLKHRGLGEPAIFLIWGPLMICGTYYVMAGTLSWAVLAASAPYGIGVTSVLMGKHLDKADKDRAKGVKTLPVVLGDQKGRSSTQLLVFGFYIIITALVVKGWMPWPAILALVSLPRAARFISVLNESVPASPVEAFARAEDVVPADLKDKLDVRADADTFPLWPLWYVAWGVWWVRVAGGWLVAGLVLGIFW
ncbi:MAG: prenyltransferase [bacterium]